jgi:hypothetical protein
MAAVQRAREACRARQEMVKRGLHTLSKAEYQLMYVVDGLAADQELEDLKTMQATQKFG